LRRSSINTQEQALAWLAEHTNTWSVKSQRQSNVQDILSEELFPHIGGQEMNYEKACFLAHHVPQGALDRDHAAYPHR
jgi:hypothetical protein